MNLKALFRKKDEMPKCSAVIVAAGSSQRMGTDKVFMKLGPMPVLVRTVLAFQDNPLIEEIIIVTRKDKLEEVLKEVPRVREDLGYLPLVTPTSQIVGTQAVLNVIMGERYKMVTKETKGICKGEYGRTPVPIDEEFRKKIIGDEKAITCRPADLLKPELEKLKKECAEWIEQDEDVLSYALFDQVAVKFFEQRRAAKYKIDNDSVNMKDKIHYV